MKFNFTVQKNESFATDQDAWVDVIDHASKHLAQVHMQCIQAEHRHHSDDIIMVGASGSKHEGVIVALAPDCSQVAYRIEARGVTEV